ncbi:hypothetical protein Y032_0383g379 [Ancylostoma ceylanicum]|uniref:Uncharacterized protein n=1 Tax=Ancylostoma ceylanicum TaxID=53326 RepID=A0A016RT09_9BILA|nr:hypothetical protein Y032_0383g379 [Ancylostoma ceylanicum]
MDSAAGDVDSDPSSAAFGAGAGIDINFVIYNTNYDKRGVYSLIQLSTLISVFKIYQTALCDELCPFFGVVDIAVVKRFFLSLNDLISTSSNVWPLCIIIRKISNLRMPVRRKRDSFLQ